VPESTLKTWRLKSYAVRYRKIEEEELPEATPCSRDSDNRARRAL
jgi:hypothetical protein